MTALERQEEWEDSPERYPQIPPYKWRNWHDGDSNAPPSQGVERRGQAWSSGWERPVTARLVIANVAGVPVEEAIESERERLFNSAGRLTASPLNDCACPGKPAAEYDHQNVIAAFDTPAAIGFIERDRYGGSGGVAVAVQIHKHLVSRNAEPIRDRIHDPQIRLMRNHARDVFDREAGLVEGFFGRV
jgi:hypothetical protein